MLTVFTQVDSAGQFQQPGDHGGCAQGVEHCPVLGIDHCLERLSQVRHFRGQVVTGHGPIRSRLFGDERAGWVS